MSATNEMPAGAVSDTLPVLAITAAGAAGVPASAIVLALSVTDVPSTVAPLMPMADAESATDPALLMRSALTVSVLAVIEMLGLDADTAPVTVTLLPLTINAPAMLAISALLKSKPAPPPPSVTGVVPENGFTVTEAESMKPLTLSALATSSTLVPALMAPDVRLPVPALMATAPVLASMVPVLVNPAELALNPTALVTPLTVSAAVVVTPTCAVPPPSVALEKLLAAWLSNTPLPLTLMLAMVRGPVCPTAPSEVTLSPPPEAETLTSVKPLLSLRVILPPPATALTSPRLLPVSPRVMAPPVELRLSVPVAIRGAVWVIAPAAVTLTAAAVLPPVKLTGPVALTVTAPVPPGAIDTSLPAMVSGPVPPDAIDTLPPVMLSGAVMLAASSPIETRLVALIAPPASTAVPGASVLRAARAMLPPTAPLKLVAPAVKMLSSSAPAVAPLMVLLKLILPVGLLLVRMRLPATVIAPLKLCDPRVVSEPVSVMGVAAEVVRLCTPLTVPLSVTPPFTLSVKSLLAPVMLV